MSLTTLFVSAQKACGRVVGLLPAAGKDFTAAPPLLPRACPKTLMPKDAEELNPQLLPLGFLLFHLEFALTYVFSRAVSLRKSLMVHNAVPSLLLPSTKPPRQPGGYEHTKGTPWVPILCHLWGQEQAGGCSQHLSTMLAAPFPLPGSWPRSLWSWEPRCRIPLGSTALPAAPRSWHTSLALHSPVQALETNPALGTRGALSCPAPISPLLGLGMRPLLPRHGLEGRPGISLMLHHVFV